MTNRTKILVVITLQIIATGALSIPVRASANVLLLSEPPVLPFGVGFNGSTDEQPEVLREISFGDRFKFPIVQQPHGDMVFVSPLSNYVTEYQAATKFGTIGLLAHNYLAGQYFFDIVPGQEITLTYSDWETERFVVKEMKRYQALVPESPSSDFIDLMTGETFTAAEVFRKTYGSKPGRLILQTCISSEQNSSWGRLFIIAEPIS